MVLYTETDSSDITVGFLSGVFFNGFIKNLIVFKNKALTEEEMLFNYKLGYHYQPNTVNVEGTIKAKDLNFEGTLLRNGRYINMTPHSINVFHQPLKQATDIHLATNTTPVNIEWSALHTGSQISRTSYITLGSDSIITFLVKGEYLIHTQMSVTNKWCC